MDVACPQCGNPNLDVDAQNSVVYCGKCGFAVQVDPQTGNVTPLSEGGSAPQQAPAAYPQTDSTLFGLDKLTFFLLGLALILFAVFVFDIDIVWAGIASLLLLVYHFMR